MQELLILRFMRMLAGAVCAAAVMILSITNIAVAQDADPANTQTAEVDGEGANTGTDPRDFAPKFMPYYRHSELENGLEEDRAVLFGLHAFTKKFAMTYEIPIAMNRDVGNTDLRDPDTGLCGGVLPGGGSPTLPNGLPAEGDCEETSIGDMNLRFLYRTEWNALGADWLIGAQFDFQTASEDVLGSETFSVGPMIAPIWDLKFWPGPGAFAALMNFYFTDVVKDSGRDDVSMYVGRWYIMLPLRAPGPGLFDGIYLLPEIQPIYDFENSDFSLWAAPEFGKIIKPGVIAYLKPGFGVNPDSNSGEREKTFEIGIRYFMK
ncbi:MAG: hypothetical protein ACR2O5_05735 [Thiogranum sp.]